MDNYDRFIFINSCEKRSRPLASTPTSWPHDEEDFDLDAPVSFIGNYQNRLTQEYPTSEYRTFESGYSNNASIYLMRDNEQPQQHVPSRADKEAKNAATTLSNRESKAREREYNKKVEESHIANDNLIARLKRDFQSCNGTGWCLKNILKQLFNGYNTCPVKLRKKREIRRPSKNIASNIPSSSTTSSTNALPPPQLTTNYDNHDYHYKPPQMLTEKHCAIFDDTLDSLTTIKKEYYEDDENLQNAASTVDERKNHADVKSYINPGHHSNVLRRNFNEQEQDTDSDSAEIESESSLTTIIFGGLLVGMFVALTIDAFNRESESDDED